MRIEYSVSSKENDFISFVVNSDLHGHGLLSPFRMVCGSFILTEPANRIFVFFQFAQLMYLIHESLVQALADHDMNLFGRARKNFTEKPAERNIIPFQRVSLLLSSLMRPGQKLLRFSIGEGVRTDGRCLCACPALRICRTFQEAGRAYRRRSGKSRR